MWKTMEFFGGWGIAEQEVCPCRRTGFATQSGTFGIIRLCIIKTVTQIVIEDTK